MPPSGRPRQDRRQSKPGSPTVRPRPGPAEQALIIFAKAPIPGQVKTRLCPPLLEVEAVSLHGSMVMDILERCKALRAFDRYLACAPTTDHAFFKTMAARFGVTLWGQPGRDLGERMNHAMTTALQQGYRKVLIIGTDLPTFSAHTCSLASHALNSHDVVLGPTSDGGYYLIGMTHPIPELFSGISWSTPSVLSQSLHKAGQMGISVAQLPRYHDLDTIEDLQFLLAELHGPGKKHFSMRTANVLLALAQRHLSET